MITTYERGKLHGERSVVLRQLQAKFGALSPQVQERVEALSAEELQQLQLALLNAQSLKELNLED